MKPRSSLGGTAWSPPIWNCRSNHHCQPTHPSRHPIATSPYLHSKRRLQRYSPIARSAVDLALATTRSTAEASSPPTSPQGRCPACLDTAPPLTDSQSGFPIPYLRLHGENPLEAFGGVGVICPKCIYNFWCSMLVYTPLALCFVTRHGIFMHFPELTY
jgi:hypothetical protein